jgi:hypothetical protein
MTFEVQPLRFTLEARGALWFPPGKAGNVLRGGFGVALRRLACRCPGDGHADSCVYARVFEPEALARGPSGLADLPRPFVFRAAHLDGRRVAPGEQLHFDVNLFYQEAKLIDAFGEAIETLAREGLGPGRGRAVVAERSAATPPVVIDLAPDADAPPRVVVRFLTPTQLKQCQRLARRPEFAVLFARARDRVSTLRATYGPGPLAIDFRALGDRAAAVRMVRCDLRAESFERTSSRTGQTHPLGGFTGEAEYEGALAEFLPILRAAQWTGVGRQTVWGKGAIEVVPCG